MQEVKVKCQSVQKIDWIQTDEQMDRQRLLRCVPYLHMYVVGKYTMAIICGLCGVVGAGINMTRMLRHRVLTFSPFFHRCCYCVECHETVGLP